MNLSFDLVGQLLAIFGSTWKVAINLKHDLHYAATQVTHVLIRLRCYITATAGRLVEFW